MIESAMPQWVKNMPAHLYLSPDQIVRLEALRKQIDVSHEEFLLHIMSHRKMTEMTTRYRYNQAKAKHPSQSEKILFSEVLLVYAGIRFTIGVMTKGIDIGSGQEEIQAFQIASLFQSVDDLVAWVVQHEYTEADPGIVLTAPEYIWAEEEITKILSD